MRKSQSPSAVLVRSEKGGKLLCLSTALRIGTLGPGWEKPGWFRESHSCVKLISFLFWIFESELLHVLTLWGGRKHILCIVFLTGQTFIIGKNLILTFTLPLLNPCLSES